MKDNLSVTVFLHGWAFQAEFPRSVLSELFSDIDEAMTESGIPEDVESRVQAAAVGVDESIEIMEHTDASEQKQVMHELAFQILYTFGKSYGAAKLIELRGLIGQLDNDRTLSFSPFADSDVYQQAAHNLQMDYIAAAENIEDDDYDFPPTIH